jgi:FkbM family methyltransferase
VNDSLRALVRALIPLRARNQFRILLRRHPFELRARFPDLAMMRLRRRAIVFDVGAHVGDFAEAVLAHQPWARLHAFEPEPEAFAELHRRLGPFGDVALNNLALGSENGERELLVSRFREASSFFEPGRVLENRLYGIDFGVERRISVPVGTLDDYVRQKGIEWIDLLKLDVQGSELDVLQGAAASLDRIEWIYTEAQFDELYVGAPRAQQLEAFLVKNRFERVRMTSERRDKDGSLIECDLIYRRKR